MADGVATDDMLPTLREWFREAEDTSADARQESERARDYLDGRQLTSEQVATLAERGQPAVVDNRIRPKVSYIIGVEKRTRTDPRAYPRTPDHEQDANGATDALRYACDAAHFEETSPRVLEDMLVEGTGGVDVVYNEATGDIDVIQYPWDRLFWDPRSRNLDFSDAKYLGGVAWQDEDEILAKWPGSEDAIAAAHVLEASDATTYGDRPSATWGDKNRKRVRVIQLHWVDGEGWWSATFTGGGFLTPPAPSPYVDENGAPSCSMVLQSAYIDRENTRYGIVRDMFDLQDEVNKRRSKALHLMTVRTVIAEQGAVQDVDEARAQVAKPDGFVEVAPGMRFEIGDNVNLAQGHVLLLNEAKSALEGQGPNAFLMGKQSQGASGRAIMASQQGGVTEIEGTVLERFKTWKRRVYTAIWLRIRQFWTAEKWVRITDDERNAKFVGLNQPLTLSDALEDMPPEQQQAMVAQLGVMPGDPRLSQPVVNEDGSPVLRNDVSRVMVDVVIDEAPDVVTLQQEQFALLADLAKIPGLIPPDALIEASALRNKETLLKRMRPPTGPNGEPVPPPPPPEVVKMQAELEMKQQAAQMDAQMEAQRLQAQMAADQARLQAEIQAMQARAAAEIEIARQRAEADIQIARAKALADAELRAQQAMAASETATVQ